MLLSLSITGGADAFCEASADFVRMWVKLCLVRACSHLSCLLTPAVSTSLKGVRCGAGEREERESHTKSLNRSRPAMEVYAINNFSL